MLNRPFILLPACLLAVFCPSVNASEGWHTSYEEARAVSENKGLPLLIHFHAVYCGPCRQMTSQVFSQAEVQRQLRDGMAAVEVDVSQHPDIARLYGATTVPRDVVVYPGQQPETLNVGFKSTLAYLTLLREVTAKGKSFAPKPISPKSEAPDLIAVEEPVLNESSKKVVGLEGFCPVRLMKSREWVSGREDLTAEFRGITYYFSGESERQEFLKDQLAFAPQNLGCDPILLYKDQRAVVGQITYGVFFDNQLFLFDSAENRVEFKENPLKFTRIRHAVRIDDLNQRQLN